MTLIHLDWFRDNDGYSLEQRPGEEPVSRLKRTENSELRWFHTGGFYIVRNSRRLRDSTPLACDGVWKQLADCRTPAQALAFVNRWGFLQRAKAKEEPVGATLGRAEWLRKLSDQAERREWAEISRHLTLHAEGPLGPIGKMGVVFAQGEEMERPELRFQPRSLGDAMCIQALMDITGNTKLRKCGNPACPEWFKYGPGTSHRETAMYCTPKCQKAHAYAKSKGKGK